MTALWRDQAGKLFEDIRLLSRDPHEGITRESYGKGESEAIACLADFALSHGLEVRHDRAGNVIFQRANDSGRPAIWFGSHLDSVPQGGNYDGLAGVIAGLLPGLSLASELLIWVVLSSLTVALWFKVFKPRKADNRWTADEVLGEVGLLTAPVSEFQKGRVRFQKPILGSEEWICIADSEIPVGERVRLTAIEGNTARVIRA